MNDFHEDPVMARGTVYPEHCDHMGHMNVAAYTKKFDEATWSLWVTVGFSHKAMNAEETGLAALESNFTYRRELFPGGYLYRPVPIPEIARPDRDLPSPHVCSGRGRGSSGGDLYLYCRVPGPGRP